MPPRRRTNRLGSESSNRVVQQREVRLFHNQPLTKGTVRSYGPNSDVKVAFFSRGRGRGHVVPDMAILDELRRQDPFIQSHWISYGTAANVLRKSGHNLIDLDLPDENPFLETQLRAIRILAELQPDLVVTHEEYAAAPAASLFGIPAIFITDYFLRAAHPWMQCLRYAEEIIFIDEPGHFETPLFLKPKTWYAGPFVRSLKYAPDERLRARSELGISLDCTLVLVLPGSWFTENRAPVFDLITAAFRALPLDHKLLVWIAAQDYAELSARAANETAVIVKQNGPDVDAWMAACDLALTKGTRKTSLELAWLGIPTITISPQLNPIDDIRTRSIAKNTYLVAREIDCASLSRCIAMRLKDGLTENSGVFEPTGLAHCVQRLAQIIGVVRSGTTLRKTLPLPYENLGKVP